MSETVPSVRASWLARGLEVVTIVFSILLALLADAAWDFRTDRIAEAALLASLQGEFDDAADEIANDLEARDAILEHTRVLLSARQDRALAPTPEEMPDLTSHLLDWRFYTPVHATFDDAISSGLLSLIRSTEVRETLMLYDQARDRQAVFDARERDFVTTQLESYLASRVALDRLVDPEAPKGLATREGARLLSLLEDDRFGSLLYLRYERTEDAIIYARSVERAVARVREALSAAPGPG